MNKTTDTELKIYEVNNRTTGERSYRAATNAEDACKQAGWLIGDCFVNTQKPSVHFNPKGESQTLVKIPCQTCPFQWAECKKPADQDCPTRPSAPELQNWLKQAAESHLCGHIGEALTNTDYHLGEKWVPMEQAIEELALRS